MGEKGTGEINSTEISRPLCSLSTALKVSIQDIHAERSRSMSPARRGEPWIPASTCPRMLEAGNIAEPKAGGASWPQTSTLHREADEVT